MLKILDTYFKRIQCSNEKNVPSVFKTAEESLEYNFVRFGNKYFIPAISIDIDNHKDLKKISSVLKSNKLPTPNFIVETTKGLHIHWILDNPIRTTNMSQLLFYQNIANELITLFDSDKNAMPKRSGRMFRNPLLHPTTFFTNSLTQLKDFAHIIPKKEKVVSKFTDKKKSLRYKVPDFATIKEGGRNQALFDYGRHVAYRHGAKDGLRNVVEAALEYANRQLPEPLPLDEVDTIATSITRFVTTYYNKRTKNPRTIEFNRKLARKQEELKQNELLKKWAAVGIVTIKKIRSISMREGGRIFGVHKNTFSKHKDHLISAIMSILVLLEKPLSFTIPDNNFNEVITAKVFGYQPVNALHCTSPPSYE